MTDEQNPMPRVDGDQDESIVNSHTPGAPESGFDPTPEDAVVEADHSAWMRPAVGENVRTSEVVGALAPETPDTEVLDEEPIDVFDEAAPLLPDEADEAEADASDPMLAAAGLGARAAQNRDEESGADLQPTPQRAEAPAAGGWKKWLPWIAAALVLAVVAFALVLQQTRKPVVVITPTPTPSVSKPPAVVDGDLMTPRDAELIAKGQGWTAVETLQKLTPTSHRLYCQNSTTGQPNATQTKQRTLSTKSSLPLVARHQIDNFATTADAGQAYKLRATNMAKCDDVPTYLLSASSVTGVGDEAMLMTVVFEDTIPEYHTLLLARTGTTVHGYDVTQSKKAMGPTPVVQAAASTINRQCARSTGACAKQPKVAATTLPSSGTPGWLNISDLPRVSPGAGLWSVTDVSNVTTKGSQCENMSLASVAGPTKREQRTYLMTQDNAAPQTFGVDVVAMTFKDAKAADSFAGTLRGNLSKCSDRQETAKLSEAATARGKAGQTPITATTLLVQQSMGGAETARFRTAVVTVDNKVLYLVNNPSASYDLGGAKMGQIAVRAGERATQAE